MELIERPVVNLFFLCHFIVNKEVNFKECDCVIKRSGTYERVRDAF